MKKRLVCIAAVFLLLASFSPVAFAKTDGMRAAFVTATVKPKKVTLDAKKLKMAVGETRALTATVTPAGASDKSVSFTSSKPTVASVDKNGMVTAIAAGKATITAKTVNGKKATCAVTVVASATAAETSSAPRPASGIIRSGVSGASSVTFDATKVKDDFYIRINQVNSSLAETGTNVAILYVRGGEKAALTLPAGNYVIKTASGSNWSGEDSLFGSDTSYSMFNEVFNVSPDYNYSFTLYTVSKGNVGQKGISGSDFKA